MIVLPPFYPQNLGTKPIVFLAGPIQGAPEWHQKAIMRILKSRVDCHVACPKTGIIPGYNPRESVFDSAPMAQYNWETYFLNHAAANGVILFWCAKEARHNCNRAYGQTTRWELAEWKERARTNQAHLVVGIESGWTGEKYMRHRLSQDLPDLEVHTSLGGTVKEAMIIVSLLPPFEEPALEVQNSKVLYLPSKG